MSAIVLAQNEVTVNPAYQWKDILGEQYHFPNQYRNIILPGTPFVYYRGVRRQFGKRALPEYIGCGFVGTVWRDDSVSESAPKRDWTWFCQVTDYVPFARPVPAKINGRFLEDIKARNHWFVGVRKLSDLIYEEILSLAGVASRSSQVDAKFVPPMSDVAVAEVVSEALLLPRRPVERAGGSARCFQRYSRNAKLVGDRAEEIAFEYIKANAVELQASNIVWRAERGETPGWDIDYCFPDGSIIAVEVKGSAGSFFTCVDITSGEWEAAMRLGDRYHLYLIADCLSQHPRLAIHAGPALAVGENHLTIEPVVFRLYNERAG
jgi:hypothetical protein